MASDTPQLTPERQQELNAEAERYRLLHHQRQGAKVRIVDKACRWYGYHAAAGTTLTGPDQELFETVGALLAIGTADTSRTRRLALCGAGHVCCDDPSLPPLHDHFLDADICPGCKRADIPEEDS